MEGEDILLIGGGGFVGTALARRLIGAGRRVHRLQRSATPSLGELDRVYSGSAADRALLDKILTTCRCVVHLASSTTPGDSVMQPVREGEENLLPTLTLLEALREVPGTHLIFFSSGGTVYGNPAVSPVDEAAALAPLSFHGAGKLASEAFLRAFQHLSGQDVTILRPSNLYGPDQPLKRGFGLLRTMLEHARRGSCMEIWGDGENVRDYLYIDDMVEACCHAMQIAGGMQLFNVGSGAGYSVNMLRPVVERITGRPLDVVMRPARSVDVRSIVLDSSRFRQASSWKPGMPLEPGIRQTWEWLISRS